MLYKLQLQQPIEDVDELRVLQWHAAEGEAVCEGALVVELETYKSVIEVRAGQAAVLRRILQPEGAWQKTQQPLAVLSDEAHEPLPTCSEDLTLLKSEFTLW